MAINNIFIKANGYWTHEGIHYSRDEYINSYYVTRIEPLGNNRAKIHMRSGMTFEVQDFKELEDQID